MASESFDVMISYCHKYKKEIVLIVKDWLVNKGLKVWFDSENLGNDLLDGMEAGVKNSMLIIVFLSKDYNQSHNCEREYKYAAELRKPIVLIKLEDFVPEKALALIISSKFYYEIFTKKEFENEKENIYQNIMEQLEKVKQECIVDVANESTYDAAVTLKDTPECNESANVLGILSQDRPETKEPEAVNNHTTKSERRTNRKRKADSYHESPRSSNMKVLNLREVRDKPLGELYTIEGYIRWIRCSEEKLVKLRWTSKEKRVKDAEITDGKEAFIISFWEEEIDEFRDAFDGRSFTLSNVRKNLQVEFTTTQATRVTQNYDTCLEEFSWDNLTRETGIEYIENAEIDGVRITSYQACHECYKKVEPEADKKSFRCPKCYMLMKKPKIAFYGIIILANKTKLKIFSREYERFCKDIEQGNVEENILSWENVNFTVKTENHSKYGFSYNVTDIKK